MGVTTSKTSFCSTLFGYTTSIRASVYIKNEQTQEKKEDHVLFKPFLYGLGIVSSHTSLIQQQHIEEEEESGRTDSGFLLYEKNSQLWKDLTYIDQTYYDNPKEPNNNNNFEEQTQEIIYAPGDAFTLGDLSSLCLSLHDINLSKRGFRSITPNICLLTMIRKLDLSFNYLTELPEEIACLQHLEQLNVSHNQIEFLPDTIGQLSRLVELNVSHNRLETLATTTVDQLSKLQTFNVSQNKLKELRLTSIHVNSLTSIDLSYNPIAILPAEITQLPFLRRLRLEGCPLTTTLDDFSLAHDAPSLVEICARIIVKTRQPLKGLPQTMEAYLKRGKTCSHCGGPYFESYVSRGRWIDRNDIWIPLEYRLCSAHWANESDRIYTMFSQSLLKPLEEDDCEPVKKWKHKVKSSLLKKLV